MRQAILGSGLSQCFGRGAEGRLMPPVMWDVRISVPICAICGHTAPGLGLFIV